jgi:WXG100 family type VII secretion target
MTGELRVNHGGLDAASQDLATAVKAIDDRLNRLESELAPLRSDWSGEAQQAYTVAKAKWDGAMQEMKSILAQTSTNVAQSNSDYLSADRRGASAFGT